MQVVERPFVFLGLNKYDGKPEGVQIEKNLLTFAGSRTGKGASLIIPNLLKWWTHNALVIDPKGEAAELCAAERERKFGGRSAVIDPFHYAGKLDPRFRAAFNPLDLVSRTADLHTIAEGMITRTGRESSPHWVDSPEKIITGILAYIIESPSFEGTRHIGKLPDVVADLQDILTKDNTLADMGACELFGGLAARVAKRLTPNNTEVENVLSALDTQLKWLDEDVSPVLEQSGFIESGEPLNLRDMKEGRLSLFLVLPPKLLTTHAKFFRLFVNMMLGVMQDKTGEGEQLGTRCLFILDEFYSLGHLKQIVTASGQLPSSGVHLWPFVQSIGQITELYGDDGLEIFSEDADALTIFGVQGTKVCEYASRRMGVMKTEDFKEAINIIAKARSNHHSRQMRQGGHFMHALDNFSQAQFTNSAQGMARNPNNNNKRSIGRSSMWMLLWGGMRLALPRNEHTYIPNYGLDAVERDIRADIGKPYATPEEVREQVKKHDGEKVPRSMLVFLKARHVMITPEEWFNSKAAPPVNYYGDDAPDNDLSDPIELPPTLFTQGRLPDPLAKSRKLKTVGYIGAGLVAVKIISLSIQ